MLDELLKTKELATLPAITFKILELLNDETRLNIRELAELIEVDATLTTQIIKVSNSALFASQVQNRSIMQSIVTLGLNRITNIVIGVSIFSQALLKSSDSNIHDMLDKYCWHTASTAMVSKSLVKKLFLNFKEFEFIGGLLHDIGKLTMLQYDVNLYKKVIELIENERIRDVEAEKAVYGVDHNEVGAGIAKMWSLPKEPADVIKYHSSVTQAPENTKQLIAVVSVANYLCEMWGAGFYGGHYQIDFANLPEWQILTNIPNNTNTQLDIEQITFEFEHDFKNSVEFLNILREVSE